MKDRSAENGFTLVEILVATLISAVIMAAVYTTYVSQQKSYVIQDQVAMMQQNLRNSIYSLEQEIRMAGYDPTGGANARLMIKDPNQISFTMDLNRNGATSPTATNPNEDVTFNLASDRLQRNGQAVAENISALNFVYLDQNGVVTGDVTKVHSIQVMVVARTEKPDPGFTDSDNYVNQQGTTILSTPSDHFRRRALCVEVKCRNLGL